MTLSQPIFSNLTSVTPARFGTATMWYGIVRTCATIAPAGGRVSRY